mgnify:CR=1 FL=1
MSDKDDKVPLDELCKPLSAKVMPKSAIYSVSNKVDDGDDRVLKAQRQSAQGWYTGKYGRKGRDK